PPRAKGAHGPPCACPTGCACPHEAGRPPPDPSSRPSKPERMQSEPRFPLDRPPAGSPATSGPCPVGAAGVKRVPRRNPVMPAPLIEIWDGLKELGGDGWKD